MDNLTAIKALIDDKITNTGGANTILASDQNAIFQQIIASMKWVGGVYVAKRDPAAGVVPTGEMFFGGVPFNQTTDFVITLNKNTGDGNDIGLILGRMATGDLIKLKDFSGRAPMFTYKSHAIGVDANTDPIYNITVSGFAENSNYTYIAADAEIAVLEFIIGTAKVVQFGQFSLYKANGNTSNVPESGDTVVGQLASDIFLTRGTYVSGDPTLIASYDANSDFFDPNDI